MHNLMHKRFYYHPLIIFAISSMIILISVNLAISQEKQPEETVLNVLNNCWEGPLFNVGHNLDRVSGRNWLGTTTVTINFYDTEDGSLLKTTQADIEEGGNFDVWLGDFDIQPGHFVTVTGGTTLKELVVTSLAIDHDEIDMYADTVSGTAEPNAQIRVDGGTSQEPTSRHATADVNGDWIVYFSVPQDGNPTTWDLVPGSGGVASEADYDCDETSVWWDLPLPGFSAEPFLNIVSGYQWLYAPTASIYIDDDDNLSNGNLWSVENVDIDDSGGFEVCIEEGINLQPGHFVTVTDGITTKYHVVTSLRVDEIDLDADTVSGTAEFANAQIRVDGSNSPEPTCRHTTADEEGKWTVNFKVPQPGLPIWDLVPDSNGRASEIDDDGDETSVEWEVSGPFSVKIDIKPGSYPNSINLKSKGKIPVAILTTDTFDAATVDPTTVRFGATGAGAFPVHFALEDVDDDGDYDLILHFKTKETGIECGDTFAFLMGTTSSLQAIKGTDSIKTVGCK